MKPSCKPGIPALFAVTITAANIQKLKKKWKLFGADILGGGSWVEVARLPAIEKYYSRWIAHCENRLLYEKAMLGEQGKLGLIEKKARPKQLPLCNYRAPGGILIENMYHKGEFSVYPQIEMTKEEYSKINNDYKGTATVENSHRVRLKVSHREGRFVVFLTDSKVHEKPEPIERKPVYREPAKHSVYQAPEKTEFDDFKKSLKAGVKTVVADQLFATPPELAERMAEIACLEPGLTVLEPSLGTGNLVQAVINKVDTEIFGYEINQELCNLLRVKFPSYKLQVRQADFLTVDPPQTNVMKFQKIIMNPPFKNGDDIKHIKHALKFLAPDGILVALCANGPRQKEQLEPLSDYWEPLPEGTFKTSGTMVNAVLLVING